MSELQIEKNVPLPRKRGTAMAATLRLMEVGDSVFIPGGKITSVVVSTNRVQGAKFTSRTLDGGVRVWRIA